MNALRQGDVFLIPKAIPAAVSEVARDAGRVVLAYGEATGHSHAIGAPIATLLRTETDERFLRIVGAPVDLVHEEHATISVAPGEYRVVIGREWSSDMEVRQVVD